MPTISTTLPSDGETIDASDVNTPFNDILSVVNGGLDSDNLAANAVGTSEIADGAVTQAKLNSASLNGWLTLSTTPTTVTNNGNRSYDLVFNSTDLTQELSEGMRLKLTRTTTAPTQSTSLNGTTQYWSKSSPAGTTFTDDFCAGAWVYLTSYQNATIIGRYNGTSGWKLVADTSGSIQLQGFNASASNYRVVVSSQAVPLNKWVYVAAQLDMSAHTASTTQSYIMIDGVDVPASVAQSGTNPTALVQAGDLQIGAGNSTGFFPGKIAQAWYSNAKITQATIKTFMSQGMTGSETSIVSAYSFNGVATDLNTTNANNLSATASAGYTTDSPFALGSGNYETAGTTEYAVVTKKPSFSTNTTVVVQVPSGGAIPTSGGVSAVSYSTQRTPYGFPAGVEAWSVETILKAGSSQSSPVAGTWYNVMSANILVPTGRWRASFLAAVQVVKSGSVVDAYSTLSTGAATESDSNFTVQTYNGSSATSYTANEIYQNSLPAKALILSSAATYYLNHKTIQSSLVSIGLVNSTASRITLIPDFL